MKKIKLIVLLFSAIVLFSCSKENEKTTGANDSKDTKNSSGTSTQDSVPKLTRPKGRVLEMSKDSRLEWQAKKVTGEHHGTVSIARGEVYVDNDILTGGNFAVDMNTITVLGMDDTASVSKLTKHLKSDDFFASEKFPIGRFVFSSAEPVNDDKGNNYLIKGFLMIKNIQHPITFPAKVDIVAGKVTCTAEIVVDRTKYDVKFRSGKFFENLGDNLIYDDFTMKVFFTAG